MDEFVQVQTPGHRTIPSSRGEKQLHLVEFLKADLNNIGKNSTSYIIHANADSMRKKWSSNHNKT